MAYRVGKQNMRQDGTIVWRLTWEQYKGQKRFQRHVPKKEWGNIGFNPEMTMDEAKGRATQLNSQIRLQKDEARRNQIQERIKKETLIKCAHLPKTFVTAFENEAVPRKRISPVFWRTAQRVIRETKLDPSEWSDYPEPFYQYFEKRGLSLDYTRKVLRVLNYWGHFISKKTAKAFLPIPYPITYHRERINDAYFDKNGSDQASNALTPNLLRQSKSDLKTENYHWLYIAMWFGLRPEELDNLKLDTSWKVERSGDLSVLWVYQSKLRSIPRQKRWKLIPVLYKEQKTALELIRGQDFKRPLTKTLRRVLGEGYYTYCGRKGFTDLMLQKGHGIEDIAAWLGHKNIKTTWEKYKDRLQLTYRAVG